MSWLPKIGIYSHFISESDFEAEGRILQIIWFCWVVEVSLARIDRHFEEELGDAG